MQAGERFSPIPRHSACLLALLAGVASPGVFGQAAPVPLESAASLPSGAPKPAPTGGIPFGPLIAYPGIDLAVGYNDNLFSSNINKRSSTQYLVSPYVRVEAVAGPHKFDATFRVDDTTYANSRADNSTNYSLIGNASLAISGRAGLKLRAESRHGIDPRGSTDRAGSATPDEYVNQGVEGIFSYGAPGAQGRIEVDGAAFSRRYQNNRAVTEGSDRDSRQLGLTFLWRVAPKTEILALVQHRSADYLLQASTQDSTEMRYQVGAKWEATAKTAGIVKFGYLEKKFDATGRTDFSGSSWDAAVRWSPLTYSVLDFNTSKVTNESTGAGDFLLTSSYGVNWNHAWNSRFSSAALGNWRKDEFLGTAGGRVDKTGTLGLRLTYQWQRWLRFGAEYTWTDRTSNQNAFDFTRNLIMFTVGASL
jgi:hypothetical protein